MGGGETPVLITSEDTSVAYLARRGECRLKRRHYVRW